MLEAYAVGVNLQVTSNALAWLTRFEKQLGQVDKALTQITDKMSSFTKGMASLNRGGFGKNIAQDMRTVTASVQAATAATNQLNAALRAAGQQRAPRAPSAAGPGGPGGNGRSPVPGLPYTSNDRALAEHYNRDLDTRRANQRALGGHLNSGIDARYANDRSLADHMNRDIDARAKAAANANRFGAHDLHRTAAGLGGATAGLGHIVKDVFGEGIEVGHLKAVLALDDRIGAKGADHAAQVAFAATKASPGSTISGNLHALMDLKTVFGDMHEAETMLPAFAKMTAMFAGFDKKRGGKGDQAFAAAKAMEVFGDMIEETHVNGHTVRSISPEKGQASLDAMMRVYAATNGRVDPASYLAMAKQSRVAGMLMTDEFKYEKLPALMAVLGGSRTGTAMMSMAQVFMGGKLTDKSYDAMAEIGLAAPVTYAMALDPKTGKMKRRATQPGIYDLELMGKDPVEWMKKAQERMEAKGVHGSDAQITALMKASQRSTIAGIFADILKDMPAILKEQQNIRHTNADPGAALRDTDPQSKLQQLTAAWTNLMGALGSSGATDHLVVVMDRLTNGLNRMSQWAIDHPNDAKMLVDTAAGLVVIGTALTGLTAAIWAFGPAVTALRASLGLAPAAAAAAPGAAAAGGGFFSRLFAGAKEGAGQSFMLSWLFSPEGQKAAHDMTAKIKADREARAAARAAPQRTETIDERRGRIARQRQVDPMSAPGDGFDVDGTPLGTSNVATRPQPIINLQGDVNLDGQKVGEIVGRQVMVNQIQQLRRAPGGSAGFDMRVMQTGASSP